MTSYVALPPMHLTATNHSWISFPYNTVHIHINVQAGESPPSHMTGMITAYITIQYDRLYLYMLYVCIHIVLNMFVTTYMSIPLV